MLALVAVASGAAASTSVETTAVVYGSCIEFSGPAPAGAEHVYVNARSSWPRRRFVGGDVENGRWRVVDSPPVSTTYRIMVAASDSVLATKRVLVRPKIVLELVSRRPLTVGVRVVGARSFVGRAVVVQRRGRGGWLTEQRLRLDRASSVRFVAQRPLARTRVVLPKSEAGAGYLSGISETVVPAGLSPRSAPNVTLPQDRAAVVAALRDRELALCFTRSLSGSYFGVPQHVYVTPGGYLALFEFSGEAAARDAGARISPDGHNIELRSGGFVHVDWIDAPHWYRAGRVLLLYLGSHELSLQALRRVLGPQFAGAPPG